MHFLAKRFLHGFSIAVLALGLWACSAVGPGGGSGSVVGNDNSVARLGGGPPGGGGNFAVPIQETGVAVEDVRIGEPWAKFFVWVEPAEGSTATVGKETVRVRVRGRLVDAEGCPYPDSILGRILRIHEPTLDQVIDAKINGGNSFQTYLEVLPSSFNASTDKPVGWKFYISGTNYSGALFDPAKSCSGEVGCLQLNSDWSPVSPPVPEALDLKCVLPPSIEGMTKGFNETDQYYRHIDPNPPDPPYNDSIYQNLDKVDQDNKYFLYQNSN